MNIELLGMYVLSLKKGQEAFPYNYVYLVYKVSAVNPETNNHFNYYWYGYFQDIGILTDGTFSVDLDEYYVSEEEFYYGDEDEWCYGYQEFESLFYQCIVSQIETYQYTSNINENQVKENEVNDTVEYATETSDIPSDIYDKMDKKLRDFYTDYFDSWPDEILHNMQLLGEYVISAKDNMSVSPNNYVYLVYKVTVENPNSNGTFNYYWYGCYKNVILLEDGTCSVDLSDFIVPDEEAQISFEGHSSYYYYGYKSLNSLIEQCVISKIEEYRYSTNVVN